MTDPRDEPQVSRAGEGRVVLKCPVCEAVVRFDGVTQTYICPRPTAFCSRTYTRPALSALAGGR